MKSKILLLAALAASGIFVLEGCATDMPPMAALPVCPTPSECSGISYECNATQLVWLDFEPQPWGPGWIACCPLFPEKTQHLEAPICAELDTTAQPWQLRVWSDSVALFQEGLPPYFCMDEYSGHYYSYFDCDTLKVDLRDYWQVKYYLYTQEQIHFVVEIHCPD